MTNADLRRLFDFQRFEKNARLQAVIDETHARIKAYKLSDDVLDLVSAAGDGVTPKKTGKKG